MSSTGSGVKTMGHQISGAIRMTSPHVASELHPKDDSQPTVQMLEWINADVNDATPIDEGTSWMG